MLRSLVGSEMCIRDRYLTDRVNRLQDKDKYPRLALKASEKDLGNQSQKILDMAQAFFAEAEREIYGDAPAEAPLRETAGDMSKEDLQAAVRDLAARLEHQDRGQQERREQEEDAMGLMQGALVELAEENVMLQTRLAELEHIALAAALAPTPGPSPRIAASTPPQSPSQNPLGSEYVTPPSPLKASRLDFQTVAGDSNQTPEVASDTMDGTTPPKISKLDLQQQGGNRSPLQKAVDEATAEVVSSIPSPRKVNISKRRLDFRSARLEGK
eukprot:TRINITY_DN5314_c0_g1_i1.p1 TRINITY_DN5314_c0_g1~~TRINITY_DN5314_c0_g1_i1.p1  ORF type:complete len:270 (-),score=75.20 TRINITY_DN5314_c0_g1_i1:419-1228(-)